MTEYRFTLQKYKRGSKHTCPKCGKKQCFVRYIDLKNEINFPDYVGRCDHEVSCQYHYKPSDYFKDNPNTFEENRDIAKRGGKYAGNARKEIEADTLAIALPHLSSIA